jgi:hypothetical protein
MADGRWARSCVALTCSSSSTAESTSRGGPSTGTVFAVRDRHPAPESGGYRPIRGEADVEALAPWVRHVPHPQPATCPSPELPRGRQPQRGRPGTYQPNPVGISEPSTMLSPASVRPTIDIGRCPRCGSQHPAPNSGPSIRRACGHRGGSPPDRARSLSALRTPRDVAE